MNLQQRKKKRLSKNGYYIIEAIKNIFVGLNQRRAVESTINRHVSQRRFKKQL